jgi:hypothetical protein
MRTVLVCFVRLVNTVARLWRAFQLDRSFLVRRVYAYVLGFVLLFC